MIFQYVNLKINTKKITRINSYFSCCNSRTKFSLSKAMPSDTFRAALKKIRIVLFKKKYNNKLKISK